MSKLSATQNIIRNKFEKVYTNRLEHEQDVEQALKPLTANASTTVIQQPQQQQQHITYDLDLKNNLAKTINSTPQLRLSNKSYLKHPAKSKSIKKHCDPNELCDNLRMLLSTPFAVDMNSINAILGELRNLEIIV